MSRPASRGAVVGELLWRWAPPVLWMASASLLSMDGFSSQETGRFLLPFLHWLIPGASPATLALLHVGLRKGMHAFEYGVLALLWYRALMWGETGWRPQAAALAFMLTAGFAAADEVHQAFAPHRTAAVTDVGWDSLGAFFGLASFRLLQAREGEEAREEASAPGRGPAGGAWLG